MKSAQNQNLKIAHFVVDQKFTDYAYDLFESVAPGANTFFVPGRKNKLLYIRKTPARFINRLSFKSNWFWGHLKSFDFVVLHSLNSFNSQVLAHAPDGIKFVWVGMGYDYYSLICEKSDLYLPRTREIADHFSIKRNTLSARARAAFRSLTYRATSKWELLNKVSLFAPVLGVEYDLIKNKMGDNLPPYVDWNYGVATPTIERDKKPLVQDRDGILLGNSAHLTNNHLDAMDLLAALDGEKVDVVSPLSYGNKNYGQFIAEQGARRFGARFAPLMEFLSYEDYMERVSGCSNVFMNSLRQQAGGNIAAMLFRGAKVFLDERNPLYSHYVDAGVKLYSTNELAKAPDLLGERFSSNSVERNREVLRDLLSRRVGLEKTRILIERVLAG